MPKPNRNVRELLKGIGIGDFNATMIIQYMFLAPATTDPKSSPIILTVTHIQKALNDLGANIAVTGYLDVPTANAIEAVVGPNWEKVSWASSIGAILDAKQAGMRASAPARAAPAATAVGSYDLLGFLPDVPGGLLTYAVGGLLAWHYLRKKR
jgi:hypothetical protein